MVSDIYQNDYQYILEKFGEDKISKRYVTIYNYLSQYISRHKLEDKIIISQALLNQAILDYFADIYRLKDFHDIDKVNPIKIYAYTAFWLLKRKPLQIIDPDLVDVDLAFVNEKFVCGYLMRFLLEVEYNVAILEERKNDFNDYSENLIYFLQYRLNTPQMIETMLMSFRAGRSIQYSVDYQK